MTQKFAALKKGPSYDFYGNSDPKCPHCGEDFNIRENEAWYLYNDNENHSVQCSSCSVEFSVNSIANWSFSTDEQDDDE